VHKPDGDGNDYQEPERRFDSQPFVWPGDQLKVKGLVGDVRRYVNVKHSFTRMQQADEGNRLKEAREKRKAAETKQKRRDDLAALRTELKLSPASAR
jgi:hypothetical protein